MARNRLELAVYGDIDLNLLDGSSIWLNSLVQVLSLGDDTHITLFLKAPEERELITGELKTLPNVELIPCQAWGHSRRRASVDEALKAIGRVDEHRKFNAVILRGMSLCHAASGWPALHGRIWAYLTDIPQQPDFITPEVWEILDGIVKSCAMLLCQTEDFRSFLERLNPSAIGKCRLLPPMIPRSGVGHRPSGRRREGLRIVYAGKFAPLWASREMISVFEQLHSTYPITELEVYGDKIHNPSSEPTFMMEVQSGLSNTPGIKWHRAVPRDQLMEKLKGMDLAWAWRDPALDDSLELSTKVLEYGLAGLPVLLNRNSVNEQLLGEDYPLFASDSSEVSDLLERCIDDNKLLECAAERTIRASSRYTFESIFKSYVEPLLAELKGSSRIRNCGVDKLTLLIAGHDLRFSEAICARLEKSGISILRDTWDNHDVHNAEKSLALLNMANVIWCEWCLGNAAWYSQRVRESQRLIIRLHLQERETSFPGRLNLSNVERIVFVGPHIRKEISDYYGWPEHLTTVIGNAVDIGQFDRPKLPGSAFNLGMVGICPMRKRLDRALDIVETLRANDQRFKLFIKGQLPDEYPWLWRRDSEREYYHRVFARIGSSPLLRDAVVFDGYGADIAAWYRKIGWILSTSDFESFHMAVAEGAASGAIPAILPWEGAHNLYPDEWISQTPELAALRILASTHAGEIQDLGTQCRKFITHRYGLDVILREIEELIMPSLAAESACQ